jgi:hypothetical protein
MAKTKTDTTTAPHDDAAVLLDRLRRHLAYLGLTHTFRSLDDLLAWASRERPGHTAWLEHVLAGEVDHKSAARIARRIQNSGLVEHKTLEAFDWDFQPSLDKALVIELARLDFVQRRDDLVITGKSGTCAADASESEVNRRLSVPDRAHEVALRHAHHERQWVHDVLLGLLLGVLVPRTEAPLLEESLVDDRIDGRVDHGGRERQARGEHPDLLRPSAQSGARAVLEDPRSLGEIRRQVRQRPRGQRRRGEVREQSEGEGGVGVQSGREQWGRIPRP